MSANQIGRRKQYHSDACKKAAKRRKNTLPSTLPMEAGVCPETALQPIDFIEAKNREEKATCLCFEEVNKATLKLVGDEMTIVPLRDPGETS